MYKKANKKNILPILKLWYFPLFYDFIYWLVQKRAQFAQKNTSKNKEKSKNFDFFILYKKKEEKFFRYKVIKLFCNPRDFSCAN